MPPPLVLHWKNLIAEAKEDGTIARAKALRRSLANNSANELIDEAEAWDIAETTIIEKEIEEIILGGRDINNINSKNEEAAAKTFYDIASGQITTLDDYVAGWIESISHLKPRTINRMRLDVEAFLKKETCYIPTRVAVTAWIRSSHSSGTKSIKRRLGSLNSFWEYLLTAGIVSKSSPFSGQKLPRDKASRKIARRAFSNTECLYLIARAKASKDKVLADLIMLGLYTGARIEELCQLRVDDVIVEDNHRALRINQSKTQAGARTIPIHPLINDIVDELIYKSEDGYLILSKSENQYNERSIGLGRRFGRLKLALNFGPELVFHSLRKTVTTKLEQAGVIEGVAADIVGHEKQTMTYGLYSGGTSMAQKMEAISKISY